MSRKAGALLWNRMRITLTAGTSLAPSSTDVDTGLTQLNKSFESESIGEPILGIPGTAPPAPGTTPASRVQVLPQAPTGAWANVTHSEPYFNTTTGTVHVVFANAGLAQTIINAWFLDPHSIIGPGDADTYNAPSD